MNTEDSNLTPDQQRELDAFESAFNGHPVDAGFNDLAVLATALEGAKPEIDPDFSAELDQRVADRFPAGWTASANDRRPLMDRLRARFSTGRSLLLPVTAGLAGVLIVGTFVATGLDNNGSDPSVNQKNPSIFNYATSGDATSTTSDSSASSSSSGATSSDASPSAGGATAAPEPTAPGAAEAGSGNLFQLNGKSADQAGVTIQPNSKSFDDSSSRYLRAGKDLSGDSSRSNPYSGPGRYAAGVNKRAVAHKTQIVLGTNADGVQDVSNQITSVVDSHNGIVLDSNVEDGPEGVAGASFRLLIPTAQLESAVGDLSQVADLRSRTQQATDITAPTLTVEDKLATARAEAQGLVKELSEATTDEDRAAIKAELSDQRAKVARLTTKANRLSRRASLTPVSVDVQTGEQFGQTDNGKWGPGDAIHDIGGFLGTAAGVALIVLAVVIPLALLALLIALINRAWVRTSRRRVMDQD